MSSYKAARLGVIYNLTVPTQAASPFPALTSQTKHRVWMKPTAVPPAGTPSASINVYRRDGSTRTLENAINSWANDMLQLRYRTATGANLMTFGNADVFYYPEGSDVGIFITSQPITYVAASATGNNNYGSQVIATFRSAGGTVLRLVFNHGIDAQNVAIGLPSGNAGLIALTNWVTGAASPLTAIDGTHAIAGIRFNAGVNEALTNKILRP